MRLVVVPLVLSFVMGCPGEDTSRDTETDTDSDVDTHDAVGPEFTAASIVELDTEGSAVVADVISEKGERDFFFMRDR